MILAAPFVAKPLYKIWRDLVAIANKTEIAFPAGSYDVHRIDAAWSKSFLCVRSDGESRLFVGCREVLLVFDPNGKAGWQAARELYRFPDDSWVNDISIRGDDLFVTTSSALYRLPGARLANSAVRPERLVWGIPLDLHVSMHSMAWGPEGDLYFSAGDPFLGYSASRPVPDHWSCWTWYHGPDATPLPFYGSGGVFRCSPDGRRLEVIATGLRGPFGLAFDPSWNLYVNDNDHESRPDLFTPMRLFQVVPFADYGWPRGWLPARSPARSDVLPGVNDDLGPGVPIALTIYQAPKQGGAGPTELLMARWEARSVTSFQPRARRSGLWAAESTFLQCNGIARPLGLDQGPDGTLYMTLCHMIGNEWSPHYYSELFAIRPAGSSGSDLLGGKIEDAADDQLYAELDHPLWVRRYAAHQELIRRGGESLRPAVGRLATARSTDQRVWHLAWLAAQSDLPERADRVRALFEDADPAVRLLAARIIGRFPTLTGGPAILERACRDPDAAIRLAGLVGLIPLRDATLETILAVSSVDDPNLRQLCGRWGARGGLPGVASALVEMPDPEARLIGVLAIAYALATPSANRVPADLIMPYPPGIPYLTVAYADRTENLAERAKIGCFTTSDYWQRVTKTDQEETAFARLRGLLHDPDRRVAMQAAYFLDLLADPRSIDEVRQYRSASLAEDLRDAPQTWLSAAWIHPGVPDLLITPEVLRKHAGATGGWLQPQTDAGRITFGPLPDGATRRLAYWRLTSPSATRALLEFDPPSAVAQVLSNRREQAVDKGRAILALEPGLNEIIVGFAPSSTTVRIGWRSPVAVELSAPPPQFRDFLAERLARGGSVDPPAELQSLDWAAVAKEGDLERGRLLFGLDGLGCVKCHAVVAGQSGNGAPSLIDAGKKLAPTYLAESVLYPSKVVDPAYRSTIVEKANGTSVSGLAVKRDQAGITLLLPDARQVFIAHDDIEQIRASATSPMPAGLVNTRQEMADLLAYLLDENRRAP